MSVDIEQRLRVFFASAPQREYVVETIELSHSALSQVWRFWHEPQPGVVTLEDGAAVAVAPANFEVQRAGSGANLDQVYQIMLDTVDAGVKNQFRAEMRRVPLGSKEKVRIVLREYLSGDLTDVLSRGVLQLESVSYKLGAASLKAVSPRLNMSRTGELYVPREVPMLRSFT